MVVDKFENLEKYASLNPFFEDNRSECSGIGKNKTAG
mgnify:CR=1 FL=1